MNNPQPSPLEFVQRFNPFSLINTAMKKQLIVSLTAFAVLFLASLPLVAGPLMMHEKAETMPTNLQGPFVVLPDGEILTVKGVSVHRSKDKGKTWSSEKIMDADKFHNGYEGAIVRTPDGTIVFAFHNTKELSYGNDDQGNRGTWGQGDIKRWILPVYVIRSTDDGKTWSEPILIQKSWNGATRSMIQLKSGRILLVGQSVIPWTHTTLTYASDDGGKTWKASNEFTIGEPNSHDHDGAMEAMILQRNDNSVSMLIRTTKGVMYESISTDDGMTWSEPAPTTIKNSHSCMALARLRDGRAILIWNATPVDAKDIFGSREELSVAFSHDDTKTWSEPVIVAARYTKSGDPWATNQVSYPLFCEIEPGVYWITSGFGTLRMQITDKDIRETPPNPAGMKPPAHLKLAEGFLQSKLGEFDELIAVHGTWKRESGKTAVVALPNRPGHTGLHLFGQPESSLVLTLPEPQQLYGLALNLTRWSSTPPFKVFVEIRDGNVGSPWKQVFSLDEKTTVSQKPTYSVSFDPTIVGAIRFRCVALEKYGVFLDDLTLKKSAPMKLLRFVPEETRPIAVPLCIRGGNEAIFQAVFETDGNENPVSVERVKVEVQGSDQLESMQIQSGGDTLAQWVPTEGENVVTLNVPAKIGKNVLQLHATAKPTATVGANVTTWISELNVAGQSLKPATASMVISPKRRIGFYLVKPGDHGVAIYRIPGLVTTNKGTLIAVYDLRHRRGNDLPNDIDIGMSRSTDGGQTWEPMKNIMDKGGHDDNEGVGDPAILVDRKTGRIWVGAAWAHKGISNYNSSPGLKLGTSGQFLVVTSDDDGLTWSNPINLTEPIAANIPDPTLKMFFNGPGGGITLRDGTLVFPAQFSKGTEKIETLSGGNYDRFVSACESTIFWSKDNGKTWTLGNGVRPKTTEAQVVELNDGSLLLTVRDERKVGTRAMFITRDLGKTWEEHPASNRAIPDPVCQASILRVASKKEGDDRDLIAFFNPNSSSGRVNLSLQLSEDEGNTWTHKELFYAPNNWGYSCMCMVDTSTIGVLYETIGGLIFEKIKVNDVLKKP